MKFIMNQRSVHQVTLLIKQSVKLTPARLPQAGKISVGPVKRPYTSARRAGKYLCITGQRAVRM